MKTSKIFQKLKKSSKVLILYHVKKLFSFNVRWSVNGQQSANETDWQRGEVEIFEMFDYVIAFRASRGSDFYSDIALDDVTVTVATCRKFKLRTTLNNRK